MNQKVADILKKVRENTPLVQAITNYVTINDCANILLCMGASPAMCEAKEEVEGFVPFISALYINVGTLTPEQEIAGLLAVKKAAELKKPVILDPVACGAIARKRVVIQALLETGGISVIKGNIGEIKFLAGFEGKVRGVDSVDDGNDAVDACVALAQRTGAVVVATGKTDIVTDGKTTYTIENGHEMLTLVTGAGCMLGAMTAGTVGVTENYLEAAVAAAVLMGMAGEKAAGSLEKPLPGSFRVKLLDYVYSITPEEILEGGKITCL